MGLDYYGILGIDKNATDLEIKKAYIQLALKYHPKKNKEENAKEHFFNIAEAYDVLSTPKRKAMYDKYGEEAIKRGISAPSEICAKESLEKYSFHGNPIKVFRNFFGEDNTGPEIERTFTLSVNEAFHGTVKSIDVPLKVVNESGTGTVDVVKKFTFKIPKEGVLGLHGNLPKWMALQHQLFVDRLHQTRAEIMTNSLFEMETPLDSDWRNLDKSGSLTKKDVLRWYIDSNLIKNRDCNIRSDFFDFGPVKKCKFYLVVCSNPNASYFTVGLCRVRQGGPSSRQHHHQDDSELDIKVAFSLLDMRDRCHHTCERTLKHGDDSVQASFDRTCYSTQHLMFLRSGCLVLHCALDVNELLKEDSPASNTQARSSTHSEDMTRDWAVDFRTLLNTGLHSDVVLKIGEQQIKAHRAILAARSPAFRAMFEHDTLEKNNNEVVITDLSMESMTDFLKFLYTGEIADLSAQELLALLVAADKYNIPKLKKQCSSALCPLITNEIALNVLVLSNLHCDEDLKNAAVQVVLDNAMEVMRSPEWLTFLKEYPEIANVIILNLAMKSFKVS
ncbi:hypothetical protein JTE90_029040 [Oedothorax gibbosus]|uniref:Uncharacterized protein n=1 Tax=Oedothorax gibbosus TaxID=931172 RepID=A0AAV6UUU5_9ARAC|nr:hypothetical protein JTE90_029040 [Oedothorax gibbosus]